MMTKAGWTIKILEEVEEIRLVEGLQRLVWPGSETDIVPLHVLVTAAHNGGLLIGAFSNPVGETGEAGETGADSPDLIGFVFGFPGLYFTPDGPRPKHCSHMLGVHPDFRDQGIGFALKRAQWQMVRHQGLDRVTWTYDPLQARNAYLNITLLGAVCSTYAREMYGEMRDGLNFGNPSDRFVVDWWINTPRVSRRLSRRPRKPLGLAHFLAAGVNVVNPSQPGPRNWPQPGPFKPMPEEATPIPMVLVEIPANFESMKAEEPKLALDWRLHTRAVFEDLFQRGYLITDFVRSPAEPQHGFYALSHQDSTL